VEVKQGYKNTDAGIIPINWSVESLGDVTDKIGSGITPTGGERVYEKEGRPFIRSQNVGWGELVLDDIAYITEETHKTFPSTEIKVEDVFLNITGASIGRSALANKIVAGGNVNQHVCIIRTIGDTLNPKFLNSFILSSKGQKLIESYQSGGNRQGLNFGQIKTFRVPIPPIKEQKAIATALSDVDELINSLEKLIVKKRNIKQGAMQQLLQPNEGWEVKKLGEVCKIFGRIGFRGYTVNDIVDEGEGAITISPSNIKNHIIDFENCTYISWFKYEESPEIKIYNGDILLVKTGSTFGKTALVKNLPNKATINPQLVVLKNITIDNIYLSYMMSCRIVQKQISTTIVGGAIPTLSQESVSNFKIPLPPTIKEQNLISQTLSCMDEEIAALEDKLEKYNQIKQGMMQNLLTGKIRLV
jgi:type I restriction enzyme S subunit